MEMKEVKAQIKDYVRDHYKYYGWYPYDVEVGNVVYSYEEYMDILSMTCLLYTSPSPRDQSGSRMPSSA